VFAVFTPTGRVFSGSLEQLRRVEKTFQPNSTRPTAFTQADITHEGINRTQQHLESTQQYKVPEAKIQKYLALLNEKKQREPVYQAYQVMSPNVQALLCSWTVAEALTAFRAFPYQLFPIVNSSRNLMGSLSRKRLYEFLLDNNSSSTALMMTIKDCFLTEESLAYSAEPVTDIRRIIHLLIDKNLDALAIVEDTGQMTGIVSRSDILQCTIAEPPLSLWC
jgi:acetoin utilization protein AcuB